MLRKSDVFNIVYKEIKKSTSENKTEGQVQISMQEAVKRNLANYRSSWHHREGTHWQGQQHGVIHYLSSVKNCKCKNKIDYLSKIFK